MIPYRQSKKLQASRSPPHSTSSPVHSPRVSSIQSPLSPDAKSLPIQSQTSVPHSPPLLSPPVAASSYEEPVIRNVNEHPLIPKPVVPSASNGNNLSGIYSEVDPDAIISIVGMAQNNEYSEAKCGRDDPNVAPLLPASVDNYESLSRGEKVEKAGHVGLSGSDAVITSNTVATSVNTKDNACKDKRPPVPKSKPLLPGTKPVQFEQSPPKPKRTYATNLQQPASPTLTTSSNPIGSSVDGRLDKPMPLPRVKSEEDDASSKVMKTGGLENNLSQDETNNKERNKVNHIPALYSYIDIDIPPDSPKQVSTEKLPSVTMTVNVGELPRVVSTTQQAVPCESTTAVVKRVNPQSPNVANKPKRRPPPPPPAGLKPKLKPVQPVNQLDSNHIKLPNSNAPPNKPKPFPGHLNTLPDPTPAKPIPPKKWFHLVTKKPGFHSPPNYKKNLIPIVAKDAGNTPPTSKRRESKKRKFFHTHKQQSEDDSAASPPMDKKPTQVVVEQDRPDSPPTFGYATVGSNKTDEKKINTVSVMTFYLFLRGFAEAHI